MADVHETANASIDKRSDVDDKPILSKFWLGEIAAAKKRDEPWWKRADKVVARYRDERDMDRTINSEKRANILWSNTETLKSALFQGLGNPDVRRRFPKKGSDDKAARQAALTLERGLSYCADAYDAESQIDAAIEDYLLPGRGTAWLVYEADVSEGYSEGGEGGEEAPEGEYGEAAGPQINSQTVRVDHVFYKDFLTSAGRKWSDVWWVARRHCYSRDELRKYWPKHADKIPLNISVSGYEDKAKGTKDEADTFKRAAVWEIWDKSKKERVYAAEEYDVLLNSTPDPYRLKDFFPTVEPLYGVKTTSSLTPVPEFTLYQDQAEELDIVQTRLCKITDAMKRRGVYDGTVEGPDNQLSQLAHADDNQFVPFKGFSTLLEKGGLEKVFQSENLAPFGAILQVLSEREQMLVQKIYDITGISDILRGSSNPNETATAQKIKGQFGSLRLQKRQKRIQCFIRDLWRLKAEILAEHFTREQLSEMTGIDMPLQAEKQQAQMQLAAIQQREQQAKAMAQQGQGAVQAPPPVPPEVMDKLIATVKAPTWEELASILRSDQRRGYKVDVETDATNALDSETEKAQRIEFITAMGTMLAESLPMIAQAPPPAAAALITLLKENAMFAAAGFKAGRTMEEAYEDAFSKLEQAAIAAQNQPPKPSPEEAKLQANMKMQEASLQAEERGRQMEFQFKEKEAAQSAQIEQRKMEHEAKLKEQELQHTMQLETFKAQSEAQLRQYQAEQDMQMRAQEFDAQQAMQERQFSMDAQQQERQGALDMQKSDREAAIGERKQAMSEQGAMHKASLDERKMSMQEAQAGPPAEGGGGAISAQIAQLTEAVQQLQQMFMAMMGGGQPMAAPAQ